MDTIRELWIERTKLQFNLKESFKTDELPLRTILLYLVSEGIVLDLAKAKVAVE